MARMTLLDGLTVTTALVILYMVWCIFDYATMPSTIEINGFYHNYIEVKNGQMTEYSNQNNSIKAKRGDTVYVEYNVTRYKKGTLFLERVVSENNREDITFIGRRAVEEIKKIESIGVFVIPLSLKNGCDHYLYSRISYFLNYNIFSQLRPKVITSPRLMLCVVD